MSIQTLYTASTGMQSLETKLDVIANNLANVNTVGFKRDRANFEDLFYKTETLPGSDQGGTKTAVGVQIGLGSKVSSVQSDFTQGAFDTSAGELDLAIQGEGFFKVTDPTTSATLYTRAGNFSINADGALVQGSAGTGRLVDPTVAFPPDTTGIVISADGQISIRQENNPQLTPLTQLTLVRFPNSQGLLKMGENLYSETDASGTPTEGTPGDTGIGSIQQRTLELSNVEPVKELIDLITTQRAFELNSQAIQAGDEMLPSAASCELAPNEKRHHLCEVSFPYSSFFASSARSEPRRFNCATCVTLRVLSCVWVRSQTSMIRIRTSPSDWLGQNCARHRVPVSGERSRTARFATTYRERGGISSTTRSVVPVRSLFTETSKRDSRPRHFPSVAECRRSPRGVLTRKSRICWCPKFSKSTVRERSA